MSNFTDREAGDNAKRILESAEWQEAWNAYRARILEEIEAAPSNGQETVMHLKRLLAAATAARGHLERMVKEGAIAAHNIQLDEKRSFLKRVIG